MQAYLARRALQSILVLFLITVVTFAITNLLPGDVARAILGPERARDEEAYLALRERLGLDAPLHVQYVRWLWRAFQGDFGASFRTQELVLDQMRMRLPVTLELSALAMLIAVGIGIPAGIISAVRPSTFLDKAATMVATSGIAVPDFWLGLLLMYVFGLGLRWLPPSGYVSPAEDLGRNLKLMVMPAVTLGGAVAAIILRQTRSALLEVMQQEYMTVAWSKGLRETKVVLRHALPNALIPVLTVVGLQGGRILGGAVVVETIFGLPGIGRLAADSIFFRDISSMQAIVLFMALAVLVANLLTDVLYAYVDPRIRMG
jgi:peptide/nickel transport system permease protein